MDTFETTIYEYKARIKLYSSSKKKKKKENSRGSLREKSPPIFPRTDTLIYIYRDILAVVKYLKFDIKARC